MEIFIIVIAIIVATVVGAGIGFYLGFAMALKAKMEFTNEMAYMLVDSIYRVGGAPQQVQIGWESDMDEDLN